MKKELNIISHSHWDREWYMSWEKHRMRLVRFFDDLLDVLDSDPEYKCFHLDGQTVVLQDYLEIRPSQRERILRLIRDGRLCVGPWYVLQDEYLISGEANIRNLIVGLRDCSEYGANPVMLGYLPDAFGNISQMPQILRGFGIRYAAFGRGLTEVGADNTVTAQSGVRHSELYWQAPDGSRVLAVVFVNWYNNAMELKADRACFDRLIENCERFASTPYLLGMNGCDHQPVQADLSEVLAFARREYADAYTIVHTDFMTYLQKLEAYRNDYDVYCGEVAGQYTRGYVTFTNTASSRVPVKQRNFTVTRTLEHIAEPICTAAAPYYPYPEDVLRYSWKTLLQNYAHDSICCCNSDEVIPDMTVRFSRAQDSARSQADRAAEAIVSRIDTGDSCYNLTVFETDFAKSVLELCADIDLPEGESVEGWTLYDGDCEIPSYWECLGRTFTYTLPDDSFRRPRYVNRYRLHFLFETSGNIGYRTLRAEPVRSTMPLFFAEGRHAENEYLQVEICSNGTLNVTVKETGRVYRGLNAYLDEGEIGEGYTHFETDDRLRFDTRGSRAEISLNTTPYSAEWTVVNRMEIPCKRSGCVRSSEMRELRIVTRYKLLKGARRVEIHTAFENTMEDHRVRALFPLGLDVQNVCADGQFDLVERAVATTCIWENPSNDQRMTAYVRETEGRDAVCIASRGLHEYEAYRDGSGVLALTLLRCFAEMGDWGYFPTPNAQCKGEQSFDYAVTFGVAGTFRADNEAVVYAYEPAEAVFTGAHGGELPRSDVFLGLEGDAVRFSCYKRAEDGQGDILRLYNPTAQPQEAVLRLSPRYRSAQFCRLDETLSGSALPVNGRLQIAAKKIVTLRLG